MLAEFFSILLPNGRFQADASLSLWSWKSGSSPSIFDQLFGFGRFGVRLAGWG
jgi:hypothetical protein